MAKDINFEQFQANPQRDAQNIKNANDSAMWGDIANIGLTGLGTAAGAGIGTLVGGPAGTMVGATLGNAAGQTLGGMAKSAISTQGQNALAEDELRARKEQALMQAIAMMR